VTSTFAALAVIGPRSVAALASALGSNDRAPAAATTERSETSSRERAWGPASTSNAAGTLDQLVASHQNRRIVFEGEPLIVARRDAYYGAWGLMVFVPATHASRLQTRLAESGAAPVDRDVAETLRIETGRPLFGVDMDETTIPLEAGIEDRAISFTKGCYVGQEVIIRVLHRGHGRVAKKLVGLKLAERVPAQGDAILADGKTAGVITSAAWSPAAGSAVALGYVQRDFAEPGTTLQVQQESAAIPATVTKLPFVSA
jgi:tRNA-modifying protein YgfZ